VTGSSALGQTCQPTCDSANQYFGTPTFTCGVTGWTLTSGSCQIECTDPPPILSQVGYLNGDCPTSGTSPVGTICTPICDSSVLYFGSDTETCNGAGVWVQTGGCNPVPTPFETLLPLSPGIELLQSTGIEQEIALSTSIKEVHKVIQQVRELKGLRVDLQPQPQLQQPSIIFHECVLDENQCASLIQYVDSRVNETNSKDDFALSIPESELMLLLGTTKVQQLKDMMSAAEVQVMFRRVRAIGAGIQFHLDLAVHKRMQIVLNDDREYVGGRLIYATPDGLVCPTRSAGFASVHDATVVHGVSVFNMGTRYSLFLTA